MKNVLWTYNRLKARKLKKMRGLPVRTLIMAAADTKHQLYEPTLHLINLYQQRQISYGDMLACFYIVAPYVLDMPEKQNSIEDVVHIWNTFAMIRLPLAHKLDMADTFHTESEKLYDPPSLTRRLSMALLAGVLALASYKAYQAYNLPPPPPTQNSDKQAFDEFIKGEFQPDEKAHPSNQKKAKEAFDTLKTNTYEDIKAEAANDPKKYRSLLKHLRAQYHADKGGDQDVFIMLSNLIPERKPKQ